MLVIYRVNLLLFNTANLIRHFYRIAALDDLLDIYRGHLKIVEVVKLWV